MSCQKLYRQSLHLVLNKGRGVYSLSRMDISGLFYPSTAEAESAEAKAKKNNDINKLGVLGSMEPSPVPRIHYQSSRSVMSDPYAWIHVFALFGKNKNKILCSDPAGNTSIYNTESHSVLGMPPLNSPKGPNYMAVSIPRTATHASYDYEVYPEVDSTLFTNEPLGDHTDSLYIMDLCRTKECCFEVLAYYPVGKWRWRQLPPPPFFNDDAEYKPPDDIPFSVVNGTKICVSSARATYSFDTVTQKWIKEGDWVLPFTVEYIPELGLCLGLSDESPYELCTMDLSAAMKSPCSVPPAVQHMWQDLETPENWCLLNHFLVNLGSGRLCTAKIFDITNDQDECDFDPVVVFTGVEVLPCDVQGLRMIKHKSKCILTDEIRHVF